MYTNKVDPRKRDTMREMKTIQVKVWTTKWKVLQSTKSDCI